MNYVPLWIKTDYSILSSLIKIDDLIDYATSNNIKCIGICDDNLYYAIEFYDKCIRNGIKPIIGLEVNIGYPVLLYARNYEGYQNLCRINNLVIKDTLTIDNIKEYLSNILIILPFEYKEYKKNFEPWCDELYIGYSSAEQRKELNEKFVYINKTLALKKEDIKYLKYLYKIKEEKYDSKDNVSLEVDISEKDIRTTNEVADSCNVKIIKQDNLLPVFNSDSNFDEKEYLKDLCIKGLKKRLDNNVTKVYVDRLKYELDVISKMGFCNYFLVVWDYVKYAKKNNIMVGPGRGSAASSLVSYTLGITDIDPIKYDLLFERFLNPNRVTMPDIDIDFDADKRSEVIKYVTCKYGNEKVSGIITFSNLLAKQVIRDVSRIFEISTYKVDDLLKNFDDKKNLHEQIEITNVKRIIDNDLDLKKVYDISMHLEGLKRHTSSHAAGVIISNKELSNYVPLALNNDGSYLCGYTMNYIEELGLLKMDFLGLKNLSIVDKIINQVKDISFNEIPLDDKETYELFMRADTDGVFQFESTGMKKFLVELRPKNLNDLVAAVALFRPGPMDNISHYVARKNNKEKVTYIHDDLKDILSSTYGIIIYQEQIMQIVSKMARFTYSEADELRRAMSKKKESVLISFKDKFISGSINNGYSKNIAEEVYNHILKFANYGFNKAHSVSYAIVGYKIAYLKVHYPLYFEKEVLNNCIGLSNKTKSSIDECKRLDVDILLPSINISSDKYEVYDNKLIFPLSLIKSVGTLTAKNIVSDRIENGTFKSYLDFVKRTYKQGVDVIKNIIMSGSLDGFNITRKTMMENLDEAINYAELCEDLDESCVLKPELKEYEEYDAKELSKFEMKLFGFYISNHPTSKYVSENSITTGKLNDCFDKMVDMVLYFDRKKEVNTKSNEKMMFINASDVDGDVELVMFPKIYNEYFNIEVPALYKVNGKVEKRFSKYQIVIYKLTRIN